MSAKDTSLSLETHIERGITEKEARKRLAIFGRNKLEPVHKSVWLKILINQLASPLIFVLIIACLITLFISDYKDAVFIFVAVVVNSSLGFYQESKAEKALSKLKTYLKQRTRVIRDGHEREIDAEEIVPGDLIRLAQGDRVPADSRIVFVNDFQVDEAILTGESLPIIKTQEPSAANAVLADQDSMIFAGTLVTQGICTAIVCRTDVNTELGQIASLIASSEAEATPLQKAIVRFSIVLSIIICILTFIVFVIGIISGEPILEMFLTAVAIAVSAIPEGLPISMTVILAVGVERMAKRKGVVRKLVAAEALGSTTVILTDKTGTLTMAKMVLSKIIPLKFREEKILTFALSNTSVLIENPDDHPKNWRMNGRIMETALVQSAALQGMSLKKITDKKHILQSIPFNSAQKFSVSLIKEAGNKHKLVFLGAPDILLEHTTLDKKQKTNLQNQISDLASQGERVLGVATKDISRVENFSFTKLSLTNLSMGGLITFRDPVRPGIKKTIERVKRAGIKTVIMTGDHKGTAVAVARELGLNVDNDSVLDASELSSISASSLRKRLPNLTVITRVTPFDKLRIAKLFQESGETIAMTGDGVNDAPSIKQANVGIAMGSGTEVAQSVADLVLLDDNFETIVAAVEEGRQILSNIKKVLVYVLSNTTDGLILIGGSLLMGIPLPLNALQILWVNFFTDSFPAVSFAFERDTDSLTHRHKSSKIQLFDPLMKFLILVIGISTSALLFVLYVLLLRLDYDPVLVRTFTFAAFGTYTLLVALSVRRLSASIFSISFFSNRYLTVGIIVGLALMAAAIYIPSLQSLFGTVSLPPLWVLGVLLIGILNIILIELAKYFFRKRR